MLVSSVRLAVVAKASDNASSKISNSVMDKYKEEPIKKTASKDIQGYKSNYDDISLGLASLYLQHGINLIVKDDGKT